MGLLITEEFELQETAYLWNAFYVSGTVKSFMCLNSLNPHNNLANSIHPHFAVEETEAKKDEVICLKSSGTGRAKPGFECRQPESRVFSLKFCT